MILKIYHETRYSFDSDVFLEPQVLRFKPKTTSHIHLDSFTTRVSPGPEGISENLDAEDNHNQFCWFKDLHRELIIVAESRLEVRDFNPFQFLIHPIEYTRVPFQYSEIDESLLQPSLLSAFDLSDMKAYIDKIKLESEHNTLRFLSTLTGQIHADFSVESRETGPPLEPGETFKQKKGSCRDLSWMLIHLLRQSGIASRFVSGYFFLAGENDLFELHAWAEVFIPGAGWVGLDPSHGILTGSKHIPLASSAYVEATMPVTGTTRGESKGRLSNDLRIEEIGE